MASGCGRGSISPLLHPPFLPCFTYLCLFCVFISFVRHSCRCLLSPSFFYVFLSKYFLVVISASFFVSSWSLISLALICYSSGLIPCSPSPLHASILMPPFPLLSGAFITLLSMFFSNPFTIFSLFLPFVPPHLPPSHRAVNIFRCIHEILSLKKPKLFRGQGRLPNINANLKSLQL